MLCSLIEVNCICQADKANKLLEIIHVTQHRCLATVESMAATDPPGDSHLSLIGRIYVAEQKLLEALNRDSEALGVFDKLVATFGKYTKNSFREMELIFVMVNSAVCTKIKDHERGIQAIERVAVLAPDVYKDRNIQQTLKLFKNQRAKERKKVAKKISIGIAVVAIVASVGYFGLKMTQKNN